MLTVPLVEIYTPQSKCRPRETLCGVRVSDCEVGPSGRAREQLKRAIAMCVRSSDAAAAWWNVAFSIPSLPFTKDCTALYNDISDTSIES